MGFELIQGDELRSIGPGDYSDARPRDGVGDGPAFLSFDIDVIDPAFAPGTGTPEVAGLLPHEALVLLRSLAGIEFRGYDVVEVAPAYDRPRPDHGDAGGEHRLRAARAEAVARG